MLSGASVERVAAQRKANTYKYLNFDQLESYQEAAEEVKIEDSVLKARIGFGVRVRGFYRAVKGSGGQEAGVRTPLVSP